MKFTSEVNWTAFDFIVMGLLLAALAATVDVITTRRWSGHLRALGVLAALLVFLATWAGLATA